MAYESSVSTLKSSLKIEEAPLRVMQTNDQKQCSGGHVNVKILTLNFIPKLHSDP